MRLAWGQRYDPQVPQRGYQRSLATLAVLALVASACQTATKLPSDCQAPSVQRSATLDSFKLSPMEIDVCKGQKLTLQLASHMGAKLHFQGYDDQVPIATLQIGQQETFTFDLTHAGRFVIATIVATEEHEVGSLNVHQP